MSVNKLNTLINLSLRRTELRDYLVDRKNSGKFTAELSHVFDLSGEEREIDSTCCGGVNNIASKFLRELFDIMVPRDV